METSLANPKFHSQINRNKFQHTPIKLIQPVILNQQPVAENPKPLSNSANIISSQNSKFYEDCPMPGTLTAKENEIWWLSCEKPTVSLASSNRSQYNVIVLDLILEW